MLKTSKFNNDHNSNPNWSKITSSHSNGPHCVLLGLRLILSTKKPRKPHKMPFLGWNTLKLFLLILITPQNVIFYSLLWIWVIFEKKFFHQKHKNHQNCPLGTSLEKKETRKQHKILQYCTEIIFFQFFDHIYMIVGVKILKKHFFLIFCLKNDPSGGQK